MNIWAVADRTFLLRRNVLFWSNAPMSLVVQAVERSLDNYSKYEEKMEHLMNFGDPIKGENPE